MLPKVTEARAFTTGYLMFASKKVMLVEINGFCVETTGRNVLY
jgi:hypothetical protein